MFNREEKGHTFHDRLLYLAHKIEIKSLYQPKQYHLFVIVITVEDGSSHVISSFQISRQWQTLRAIVLVVPQPQVERRLIIRMLNLKTPIMGFRRSSGPVFKRPTSSLFLQSCHQIQSKDPPIPRQVIWIGYNRPPYLNFFMCQDQGILLILIFIQLLLYSLIRAFKC